MRNADEARETGRVASTNEWSARYANRDGRLRGRSPSIVGMWHVIFTAKTSDKNDIPDTVIDDALAVWHPDKTEIMNSIRPPQDGNFCLGVWEQTGRSNYYLNHFPWFSNQFPNDTNNGIGTPVGPTPSPKPSHWPRIVITFPAPLRWMPTIPRERLSSSHLPAWSRRHGSRPVQRFPICSERKSIGWIGRRRLAALPCCEGKRRWPFRRRNCLKTGERPGSPRLACTPFSSCHSRRSTPWERAVFLVVAVLPVSGFRRRLVSGAIYSTLLWSLHGVGLVLLRWVCRFRFVCHGYSLLFTAYPKHTPDSRVSR